MAKSKRKHIDDKELPPHRLSRRLNNLQGNGMPVRSSLRLQQASEVNSSSTNNVAASITQSAKIASRSRKRNSSKSMYDIDYRKFKKQRNEMVSPSQICSETDHDSNTLSPVQLDIEFETMINSKGNENRNKSLFYSENDSNSESLEDINKSSIVDCEESMIYIDSDNDMDVAHNDNVESIKHILSDNESNKVHRICYCDMLTLPLDCVECNRQLCIPCENHIIIECFECKKNSQRMFRKLFG